MLPQQSPTTAVTHRRMNAVNAKSQSRRRPPARTIRRMSRILTTISILTITTMIVVRPACAFVVLSSRKYVQNTHRPSLNGRLSHLQSIVPLIRNDRRSHITTYQTEDDDATTKTSESWYSVVEPSPSPSPSPNGDGDNSPTSNITPTDCRYMNLALDYAQIGRGNTYPNPAVGCVLVASPSSPNDDDEEDKIIGAGFHPKSGYPHAEIFALLEAYGHLDSGVDAARSVVSHTSSSPPSPSPPSSLLQKVNECTTTYTSPSGPSDLFPSHIPNNNTNNNNDNNLITAYVTLEPCCHHGKTPPCSSALLRAGVGRVVVGYRDPNPRVDGGGVAMLEGGGVVVHTVSTEGGGGEGGKEGEVARRCRDTVDWFVRRISPRTTVVDYDTEISGAKRSALRSLAGRWKKDGTMPTFAWQAGWGSTDGDDDGGDLEEAVAALSLDQRHRWMEKIDGALWEKELVLLRLNGAVRKKKGAKLLGGRLGMELGAHVAQVVGHTVLLYRPGFPPVLDLEELVLAAAAAAAD